MKKIIPSFQIQILAVFILLLLFSVFFTRTYYLESLEDYLSSTSEVELESGLLKTYETYQKVLPDSLQANFEKEIENSVMILKDQQLRKEFFREEFYIYSYYIIGFAIIFGLLIFILSFSMIARPLKRLQKANEELGKGQFQIRVKENPMSPLNELLVSFNTMASEIEENRRLLIEAEKKMIWREIARAMAHEIKNPLTPIKLSLERLEMKYLQGADNFDEVFNDSTKIITEEVDNLHKLVNRFRGFAAIPEPEPEFFDISQQLQDIILPYQEESDIIFNCDDLENQISADKQQVKQIVSNVLQNAIHATKPSDKINVGLVREKEFFLITITDFGKGIDPENLDQIFEPYFTTKRKGTGLGLALVKQIVENHKGSISVESEVGKGTSFFIRLPI